MDDHVIMDFQEKENALGSVELTRGGWLDAVPSVYSHDPKTETALGRPCVWAGAGLNFAEHPPWGRRLRAPCFTLFFFLGFGQVRSSLSLCRGGSWALACPGHVFQWHAVRLFQARLSLSVFLLLQTTPGPAPSCAQLLSRASGLPGPEGLDSAPAASWCETASRHGHGAYMAHQKSLRCSRISTGIYPSMD